MYYTVHFPVGKFSCILLNYDILRLYLQEVKVSVKPNAFLNMLVLYAQWHIQNWKVFLPHAYQKKSLYMKSMKLSLLKAFQI